MSQKAQGISINTVIIAAIALIVLVVLVAIFTGRIGLFSKGIGEVSTCKSLGGTCISVQCSQSTGTPERVLGATDCGKDLREQGGVDNSNQPYCCKAQN